MLLATPLLRRDARAILPGLWTARMADGCRRVLPLHRADGTADRRMLRSQLLRPLRAGTDAHVSASDRHARDGAGRPFCDDGRSLERAGVRLTQPTHNQ